MTENRQDQKEAFLKNGSTETGNAGNLALPASPYPGMAGTMIAGAPATPVSRRRCRNRSTSTRAACRCRP